jgi:stearoyl-CoA desaturase (delta-9 desaturase)
MASNASALPHGSATDFLPESEAIPLAPRNNSTSQGATHEIAGTPARPQLRLGRVATVAEGLNWLNFTTIALFHVGALAAFFFFTWQRIAVMAVIYVLAINVGIGMCYHRLLTHRGYQVPRWIEYVMTFFATLSMEGGPIFWVSTHRLHHQLSDKPGDPHSPREGGWWAHTGWIVFGRSLHSQMSALNRFSPDLARDRFHVGSPSITGSPLSSRPCC